MKKKTKQFFENVLKTLFQTWIALKQQRKLKKSEQSKAIKMVPDKTKYSE